MVESVNTLHLQLIALRIEYASTRIHPEVMEDVVALQRCCALSSEICSRREAVRYFTAVASTISQM
jgi:hypothetical protein